MNNPMRFQLAALLLIITISACSSGQENNNPRSQESARQTLERKGLHYSDSDFIESVKKGDADVVDLYLAAGMSPDTKDANNVSALLWAIGKHRTSVAHELIMKGADVKRRFKGGATLLTFAALSGNQEIVQDMLSAGANPNDKDEEGHSILIFVCLGAMAKNIPESQTDMKNELPKGMDINELFDATANGYSKTAELLLNKGADPNAQAEDGETALMFAALSGDAELVETMLNKGADPSLRNKQGTTALQLAISLHRSSVIDLLRKAEAEKQ
jgi:ankyrin repeat protein